MVGCAILSCSNNHRNTAGQGISFFHFPKSTEFQKLWKQKCKNNNINFKCARICSIHFKKDDFEIRCRLKNDLLPGRSKLKLNSSAVPTLNLRKNDDTQREERLYKRNVRKSAFQRLKTLSPKRNAERVAPPISNIPVTCPVPMRQTCKQTENLQLSVLSISAEESEEPSVITQNDEQSIEYLSRKCKLLEDQLNDTEKKLKVIQQKWVLCNRDKNLWRNKYIKQVMENTNVAKKTEQKINDILEGVFTKAQIRCLKTKKTKARWENDDILNALTLRSLSKKAYFFMRNTRKIPMPGLSTLRRWTRSVQCSPGIMDVNKRIAD